MADLTPAEELRAAAARLRCKHTYPLLPPHSLWAPGPCGRCGAPHDDVPRDVPEWLREPLAAWLETVARNHLRLCAASDQVLGEQPDDPKHAEAVQILKSGPYDLRQALAVARVILGGGRG